MFPRLIVGILVTIVIVGLIKKFRKRFLSPESKVSGSKALKCAYCGVYTPSDQVIHRRGKVFCSPDHANNGV